MMSRSPETGLKRAKLRLHMSSMSINAAQFAMRLLLVVASAKVVFQMVL